MPAYSTLERAFQIAREASSIEELRTKLQREGYGDAVAQTSFPFIRRQLQDAIHGRLSTPPKRDRRRKGGPSK